MARWAHHGRTDVDTSFSIPLVGLGYASHVMDLVETRGRVCVNLFE